MRKIYRYSKEKQETKHPSSVRTKLARDLVFPRGLAPGPARYAKAPLSASRPQLKDS